MKTIFHIIKSFLYLIPKKIQALVILCDEFLDACIVEICRQSIKLVLHRLLHFFIATHARATQKAASSVCRSENHFEPSHLPHKSLTQLTQQA
jgi:hypothetical protein